MEKKIRRDRAKGEGLSKGCSISKAGRMWCSSEAWWIVLLAELGETLGCRANG